MWDGDSFEQQFTVKCSKNRLPNDFPKSPQHKTCLMSPLRLPKEGGGLVEPCVRGTRVINQIPKTCGRKSSRIPPRLYFKCAPPSLWELEDLEALELHFSPNSLESRRVQRTEHTAIKRALNMFYLPDGIMHNIYVFPVIHGGLPTVTFYFWVPPGILEGLLSQEEARSCPSYSLRL